MSARYAIPLLICQANERISRGVMVQFDVLLSAHRDSSMPLIGEVESRDVEPGILLSDSKFRLRLR